MEMALLFRLLVSSTCNSPFSLVNDPAFVVGTGPAHVPEFVVGYLRRLAAGDVVGVEIEMPVAIGVEIDRVADPHRIARRARSFGDPFGGVALQIEDVETVRLAAAVTFLGRKSRDCGE